MNVRARVKQIATFGLAVLLVAVAPHAQAQNVPPNVTKEALAKNNKLFIELASKALKWDVPTDPIRIVGPLYFVGTTGLSSWLFATSEGHILLNTGTPNSGPMIVESIRKLGFKAEDIKIIINGHGHSDHAGAFAYFKRLSGAQIAIMQPDVSLIEDGGKSDFHYGHDWQIMGQPPVKVDRVLRDGDVVRLGEVLLTARHTPGHTKGATTWITSLSDGHKTYSVVFPDGAGFNPGYRVANPEEYPGINRDYRYTLHLLESLKPDIWGGHHTEYFDLEDKRKRAAVEGVKAWIDPEGYRRFVAGKRRAFEDQVDLEMGVKTARPAKVAPKSHDVTAGTAPSGPVPVNVHNFIRAETDTYFAKMANSGAFAKLNHRRSPPSIDAQDVVRMNRDTLYSSGVFDLDASPVTITLPETGKRFMSLLVLSQDHYVVDTAYAPGRFTYDRNTVGTRYAYLIVRTFANADDRQDTAAANKLQDAIKIEQRAPGAFEVPQWDSSSLTKARDALSTLGSLGGVVDRFDAKDEVDPFDHLIGTAQGWGGNPRQDADYQSFTPSRNDGKTVYRLTMKDVPVDAFWSVSVYNAKGFFEKNELNAYSLNSLTAKPNSDGSYTIQFGACNAAVQNCLAITPGWNYTVRLYRPRKEILDGTWKVPEPQPVG
jgi:glyoxylase-like metal-dependent hydrolase (beta-lactamase superfamily II)